MRRGKAIACIALAAIAAVGLASSDAGIVFEENVGLATLFAVRGERAAPPGAVVLTPDHRSRRWLAGLPDDFAAWPGPLRRCLGDAATARAVRAAALDPVPPRQLYACAIDRLAELGAAAIVFDVAFNATTPADARLRASLERHGDRVVLLQYLESGGGWRRLVPLAPGLTGRAQTAPFVLPRVGPRVHQYWLRLDGLAGDVGPRATLPLVAFRLAPGGADPAAGAAPPAYRYFNHYGRAGTVPTLPLAVLFADTLVDPSGRTQRVDLRDITVFVGAADPGVAVQQDRFATAFGAGGDVPGVELAATAYLNLRHGDVLDALTYAERGLLVGLFTAASLALALLVGGLKGIGGLGVLGAGYAAAAIALFAGEAVWLPIAIPLLVVLPAALVVALVTRYATVAAWLSALAPPRLADMLVRERQTLSYLGRRDVCVMFTDLAGYSGFAERHEPGEVEAFLNQHFKDAAAAVEAEGGIVAAFAGDGLMAFWGAPEAVPDGAERAARAALAIARRFAATHAQRRRAGQDAVRLRIGLHQGVGKAALMGGGSWRTYTVVGDVVNMAKRVEQLGKRHQGADEAVIVLASEAVYAQLRTVPFTPLGREVLAGTERDMAIARIDPPAVAVAGGAWEVAEA